MKKLVLTLILIAIASPALAKSHHHARYAGHHHRHYGFICGATQMAHFGISDPAFRLAHTWALRFPRTTPHPGAVVFQWRSGRDSAGHQGGHVSRIVSVIDRCHAVVADSRGSYSRDICSNGAVIVDPTAGARTAVAIGRKHHVRYAHHHHRVHYASRV